MTNWLLCNNMNHIRQVCHASYWECNNLSIWAMAHLEWLERFCFFQRTSLLCKYAAGGVCMTVSRLFPKVNMWSKSIFQELVKLLIINYDSSYWWQQHCGPAQDVLACWLKTVAAITSVSYLIETHHQTSHGELCFHLNEFLHSYVLTTDQRTRLCLPAGSDLFTQWEYT